MRAELVDRKKHRLEEMLLRMDFGKVNGTVIDEKSDRLMKEKFEKLVCE